MTQPAPFTQADLLEQADGRLVLAVPQALPVARPLVVRLRPSGFEVLAGGDVIGRVDRVPRDVTEALRRQGQVGVLACPEDMDLTAARVESAQVVLVTRPLAGARGQRA